MVDISAVFGNPPDRAFLLTDGLHPSLAGHQVIVRTVVDQLTA